MKLRVDFLLVLIVGISCVACVGADNLEDEESTVINNKDIDNSKETFRNLVRPFRMEKLNLIWVKAQQVKSNNNNTIIKATSKSQCFVSQFWAR